MDKIMVQTDQFDLSTEQALLRQHNPKIGAIVSFSGLMRDLNEGDKVHSMTIEHYSGMTEKSLKQIVQQAHQRWSLEACTLIHRVGNMQPLDPIVLVMTASQHRKVAFESCEFIMDFLKTQAPFWKKETTQTGERWLEARETDQQAARRWD